MSGRTSNTNGIPLRFSRGQTRIALFSTMPAVGFAAAGTGRDAVRGRLKVSENLEYRERAYRVDPRQEAL